MSGGEKLLADFAPPAIATSADFPAVKGVSYLSVHLRFGTVSIRQLVRASDRGWAGEGGGTWLSELIWRDFYFRSSTAHPHVVDAAFRPEYDALIRLG